MTGYRIYYTSPSGENRSVAVNGTQVSLDLDEDLPVGEDVSVRAESANLPSDLVTTVVSKCKACV